MTAPQFIYLLLAAWSGAGLVWSVLSWRLVVAAATAPLAELPRHATKSLSIFKPLPRLGAKGLQSEARGLESFIAQLDDTSELLLGVHESDWGSVEPFIKRMQFAHPAARLIAFRRTEADTCANPKIAWQKILVPHATGEWWLWSDADMVAPPGFLSRARAEFAACGVDMITFPYAVRALPTSPALLDALFVNAEFYPGALLLRRLGTVDFGLGAAMLFSRDRFLRQVDWEKLGSALADDFTLGQFLQPVKLGTPTLETIADVPDWSSAFTHYLRWKKTICWCRPLGFAAQILGMPLVGWLGLVLWHPLSLWSWLGLIGMMQLEVFFATLICRTLGCPLTARSILIMEAWTLWRILFWLLCWLPLRTTWNEKSWRGAMEPA